MFAGFGRTAGRGAALLVAVGGFFVLLGGIAMWTIGLVIFAFTGLTGHGLFLLGIVLGLGLLGMGALLWFVPQLRFVWGAISIALAVLSLPFALLGGFLIGFALAVGGGILAIGSSARRPSPRIVLS